MYSFSSTDPSSQSRRRTLSAASNRLARPAIFPLPTKPQICAGVRPKSFGGTRGEKFLGVGKSVVNHSKSLWWHDENRDNCCRHAALSRSGICMRPAVRRLTFGFTSTALHYISPQHAVCTLSLACRNACWPGPWQVEGTTKQSKEPDQLSGRANLNQTEPLATLR